jgi:3-oxoacyl-[acyl-carrier protein] reductase
VKLELTDRVAVITGVSRKIGIGAAIARRLAAAGAKIFTTYYRPYDSEMEWDSNDEEAAQIVEELNGLSAAAGLEADLGDPDVPAKIMAAAKEKFGPIDILINNATRDFAADLTEIDAKMLDQHYAVNVRAPLLLMQAFFVQHDGRAGGRIINMTSGQNLSPMAFCIPYSATKASIEGLTLSLSQTAATKGITVNTVDPGATDTGWMSDEWKSKLIELTPLGRTGIPDDAARLICFLVSEEGNWITGQTIRSRGGLG